MNFREIKKNFKKFREKYETHVRKSLNTAIF